MSKMALAVSISMLFLFIAPNLFGRTASVAWSRTDLVSSIHLVDAIFDDFNDGEINGNLWVSYQEGTGPIPSEANGRLEIRFPADSNGSIFSAVIVVFEVDADALIFGQVIPVICVCWERAVIQGYEPIRVFDDPF